MLQEGLKKKKKKKKKALAGVVHWVGCQIVNQKIASSIPSWGTCLGCGLGPWLGACERQPTDVSLINVSLPLFLPPFLFL